MKPAYGFASHDLSSLRVFLIMLEYLHIRDLALISDMELEFASGMNVLTGENGGWEKLHSESAQLSDGREARRGHGPSGERAGSG